MKQIIFLFSACMIFTMTGLVFSQEMPYRLDDIVVTASRIEAPLKEAPANITVITRENIMESGAETLIDVFKGEPGVFTQNQFSNPKLSKVDIRGYGEAAPQNVLFLIDGRRINSVDMVGADLSQIPLDVIERIEIYRGPASVLFGDNAVAGVVNIILRRGEGKLKMNVSTSAGSYDFYKPQIAVSGKEKRFSYFILSSASDTSGYRHNNALRTKDLLGNFSFDILKDSLLFIKLGHHRDTYGMPGYLSWDKLIKGLSERKDSDEPFNDASTEDNFIDLDTRIGIGKNVMVSLGGSYRNRHTASDMQSWSVESKGTYRTYSFTPKITVNTPVSGKKSIFLFGFDYYKNNTSASSFGAFTNNNNDIDKTDIGLYANEKFYFADNFLIEAGYRKHKAKYDYNSGDFITPTLSFKGATSEEKESYRASMNYSFSGKWNAFFTYTKGFRFPTTDELIIYDYTTWPPNARINRNLSAQSEEEVNFGVRWNPVQVAGGSLTLFRTKSKNEIFFNPVTFENQNYDRTTRQGVESSLYINLTKSIMFNVSYSYLEAKFDGGQFDSNHIPLVPAHKLSTKLSYTLGNWNFNVMSFYTGTRYVVSDLANQQRKLPGYTTFDASLVYKYKQFGAFFAIKNLTGKKYSEYGAYSSFRNIIGLYPAPERQYLMKLEYTFEK